MRSQKSRQQGRRSPSDKLDLQNAVMRVCMTVLNTGAMSQEGLHQSTTIAKVTSAYNP